MVGEDDNFDDEKDENVTQLQRSSRFSLGIRLRYKLYEKINVTALQQILIRKEERRGSLDALLTSPGLIKRIERIA